MQYQITGEDLEKFLSSIQKYWLKLMLYIIGESISEGSKYVYLK